MFKNLSELKKRKIDRFGDFEENIFTHFIHPSKKPRIEITEEDNVKENLNNFIYDSEIEEISKQLMKTQLEPNKIECNKNDFNNFFNDELENEVIKNTLCLENDILYNKFTEYTKKKNDEYIYFDYGNEKNINDELCSKETSSKIKKENTTTIKNGNKILELNTCTIKGGKLYHGSLNYFTKIENREMWLSFVQKQSILHTIDEFYSYIVQSENRKSSLYNIDEDNKKYINVPLLYTFTTKEINNIIILDEKKLKELSEFFNIRFSTGDTSDYDLINLLKKHNSNINGWINKNDQCQILLFDPTKFLEKDINEKNIEQIFNINHISKIEKFILEEKEKLQLSDYNIVKTRQGTKLLCKNKYINFSNELKIRISKSLSSKFSYLQDELYRYNTNANYINMRTDIENYINEKLCNMEKNESVEFIKKCHESIEKFVHICLANSLRPFIYKMIMDIQVLLNGCAKIVVGGRETSNLSVNPDERVISTDIDSKIFLNFNFPEENERDEYKKETLFYIFKQKFINKMFYEILPKIIEMYDSYYSEHIYPILYKLENTFEMKILDIKFPRPGEQWLKKRFTILESDIDRLGAEDHIELFVLDMIIPQMYLPYSNPNSINEKFSFVSTTYGMLDMPIADKKGLPEKLKYYVTNNMLFEFGNKNVENVENVKAIRIQNNNFKLTDVNEFKKLYFLNKKYEIYDKERLIDIKNRTEDKLKKDKKTLEKLKNTSCKNNKNIDNYFFDNKKCIKKNSDILIENKQYNLSEYLSILNKNMGYIAECDCNLETVNIANVIKQDISQLNNKNTYLSIGIVKTMRYLAPLSLYEKSEKTNKNVFDDRTELLNKIFYYDEFKKNKETNEFKNLNSSFWKKFNLTDQEKRIKSLEYVKLDKTEKGEFKSNFLEILKQYTNSIIISVRLLYENLNNPYNVKLYKNPNKYISLIKNKLGKLLYGYPIKESPENLNEYNIGTGLDDEMLMYLTFQDMFLLIWKYWCYVLDKQSFLFPEERFINCQKITNNLLNICYIDTNINNLTKNIKTKEINLDVKQFEILLKSINENNVLLSDYQNDEKLKKQLDEDDELSDLLDKMDIDFNLSSETSMDLND